MVIIELVGSALRRTRNWIIHNWLAAKSVKKSMYIHIHLSIWQSPFRISGRGRHKMYILDLQGNSSSSRFSRHRIDQQICSGKLVWCRRHRCHCRYRRKQFISEWVEYEGWYALSPTMRKINFLKVKWYIILTRETHENCSRRSKRFHVRMSEYTIAGLGDIIQYIAESIRLCLQSIYLLKNHYHPLTRRGKRKQVTNSMILICFFWLLFSIFFSPSSAVHLLLPDLIFIYLFMWCNSTFIPYCVQLFGVARSIFPKVFR